MIPDSERIDNQESTVSGLDKTPGNGFTNLWSRKKIKKRPALVVGEKPNGIFRHQETNGADLNLKDNGTPLHWAVPSRQKENVELLFASDAMVEAKDGESTASAHRRGVWQNRDFSER
jgi:hypothetical protein